MLLSLAWLKEFVPFTGGVEELSERLTMLGLEVEEIKRPFPDLDKVVVGHVLECRRHPEADRLSVCLVDVGAGEPATIVCGAPNVAQGQDVLVALPGACLPGGLKIKAAKLRGVLSQGMICAEDELGLGESHQGVIVLEGAPAAGTPVLKLWPELDDVVLDVNITPNRPDCLSVLGLARETALAFGLPLTIPDRFPEVRPSGPEASTLLRVELPEPEICPVYRGRVVDGITDGESPWPLKLRLRAVGQRSVSKVVDVTNYIMFELGQPLHAFDLDRLQGGVISVRRAGREAEFVTLDSRRRQLRPDDLLVRDGVKPVALAGVMGGENTEFTPQSTRLFLESAVFRPASIRKTARRLALGSEASYRFERGVDQPASLAAMNKAAAMIAALTGGRLLPGCVECEPRPWRPVSMSFRPRRAAQYLCLPLDDDFCRKTLQGLGCAVDCASPEAWRVSPPSHRPDLEREVDLIEEVGRVYGMDKIPPMLPQVKKALDNMAEAESEFAFARRVRIWARGMGLHEAVNFSFTGARDLDLLDQPEDERVKVLNPLSEEQAVMRTLLAPGLLQNIRQNMSYGSLSAALFEVAHVFKAEARSETGAQETPHLAIALHGPRVPELWPWRKQDLADYDYSDLKGLIEHLLAALGLDEQEVLFRDSGREKWLSPGVEMLLNGRGCARLGRVHPDIAAKYQARREIWLAEIDLDLLRAAAAGARPLFRPLPKFPAVRRDMTVQAGPELSFERLAGCVRALKLPLLEDLQLVDIYAPEGGDRRERHITLRFVFRHPERTLTDREADRDREKIARALVKELGVTI